jgi:hypothetical protein
MNIKNVSMGIDVVSPDKLSENGFNIATDLRYDHSISYNPDNPTIGLIGVDLMDIQKSKIIYAELKNGSTYKYLWLGNDHFADLYNSWDYEDNEGKYEGMLDFDHTISYTFDTDEIKNEQSILGIDIEDGLEDGEIVDFTIRNVKWENN